MKQTGLGRSHHYCRGFAGLAIRQAFAPVSVPVPVIGGAPANIRDPGDVHPDRPGPDGSSSALIGEEMLLDYGSPGDPGQ